MEKPLALLKSLNNAENVLIYSSLFDIGRSKDAKLIILHVKISRNHCQLICSGNKTWILKDLTPINTCSICSYDEKYFSKTLLLFSFTRYSSSSGTYLNGDLIGRDNSKAIKENDIIRLGPEDCNFMWQFITNVERAQPTESNSCDLMITQSQAIVDICNEKDTLQRQIIHNRESCLKMKLEKEKLHKKCMTQFRNLDNRFLATTEKQKIKLDEIQNDVSKDTVEKDKEGEEEENKVHIGIKRKLIDLQRKITENDKKEEELKLEVQKLQEKLVSEQIQWENKFLEEKIKLEDKINEQNKKLAVEKVKIEEISMAHEQELEDILKKEEEEKRILIGKLHELEEAKKILSQKLKESDEFHLLDKARIEEEMQKELLKREENIKAMLQQQIDCIQINQIPAVSCPKDQKDNLENQDLMKELDQVKNSLIESEMRQKLLEKELAEVNSLKDQANRVKSNVLENMADLMESELQCSICSELLVTAITLNCTHTFCKYCIDLWKKKKKSCPICRKRITSENRSIVMDNYIDRMVENLSDEFKTRRRTVIEERIYETPCKTSKTASSSESSVHHSDSSHPSTSAHRRRAQGSRRRRGD